MKIKKNRNPQTSVRLSIPVNVYQLHVSICMMGIYGGEEYVQGETSAFYQ